MKADENPFPYQGHQSADPPNSIGRYLLIRELGRGAMARVYLADDPNIGRQIALKVLAPSGPVDAAVLENLRQRFLLEARAAGRLRHPAAVAIYDADHDIETGLSYIAMEWVDGRSLQQVLRDGRSLTIPEITAIGLQVAAALDAAHQQGLIHRDVKPANILLDRQGCAKLSDFGIAKLESLDLTSTGQVLGTPFYMSPEQIRGEELDGRSDLFSLGVVLYQCLTGRLPFEADSLAGVTHKILNVDPRPPQWLDESIPAPLSAAVSKTLAKDRGERYQSGADLADALLSESSRPLVAVPAPPPAPGTGTEVLPRASDTSSEDPGRAGGTSRLRIALEVIAVLLALLFLFSDIWPSDPIPPSIGEATAVSERTAPTAVGGSQTAASAADTQTARLQVEFVNRLKRGTFAVWVDGQQVLTRTVSGPKGLLKRVGGQELIAVIPIAPGHHVIEVRARGALGKYEVAKQTGHFFRQDTTHRLGIEVIPPKFLRLTWK